MQIMWNRLHQDECGGIATAETILIGTILVLGMVVALVELHCSMIAEINDISSSAGNISQSYLQSGFQSLKSATDAKAGTFGSKYDDHNDVCDCDSSVSVICNDIGESRK